MSRWVAMMDVLWGVFCVSERQYRDRRASRRLEMICVDGGAGLLAALPMVYPKVPVRRCWAHKIRNVLNKVKKADHQAVKSGLHAIINANTRRQARSAARRFADSWQSTYSKVVDSRCPARMVRSSTSGRRRRSGARAPSSSTR